MSYDPQADPPPPGTPGAPDWQQAPPPPPAYAGGHAPGPPPQAYAGGYAPSPYATGPSGLSLPAGTELAGVGRRIGAYFLAILLSIVTLGIGYVIWGLVLWPKGTSPAFRLLGLRCWVPDNAAPASFGRMALRNVLGTIVQGLLGGITALVSLVLFLARDDHKSLMDLVGGTVVISDPNRTLG